VSPPLGCPKACRGPGASIIHTYSTALPLVPVRVLPSLAPAAVRSRGCLQGLLQYSVWWRGACGWCTEYERQTGASYAWIIRTRLDAFWSAPVPPVHTFQAEAYTIPWGSD